VYLVAVKLTAPIDALPVVLYEVIEHLGFGGDAQLQTRYGGG